MREGIIFDIKKYALHDGPGIRTTVFLKGCPLRCLWCHNPEGQRPGPEIILRPQRCLENCHRCVEACPRLALSKTGPFPHVNPSLCDCCGLCAEVCPAEALEMVGRKMTPEEVIAEVMKDLPFYEESGGGVTFSGGEPLLQANFLESLLILAKKNNLHTVVDTSGQANFSVFIRILPYVDLFLYDLKLIDPERHHSATGHRNGLILENLKNLASLMDKIMVRIPVVPTINDDEANLKQMANFIKSIGPIKGVELLPYHELGKDKYARVGREYKLSAIARPSTEEMAKVARIFKEANLSVSIGG